MYILIGDSGTVVFEKTATISSEAANMSSRVTTNPVEGGSNITDHAVLDPIRFDVAGIVTDAAAYTKLLAFWRNRELLIYRGKESYNNLLITSLQLTYAANNEKGYSFRASFQQITITEAVLVNIASPTMVQQNKTKNIAAKPTSNNGLVMPVNTYAAHVASFNASTVNTDVGKGRTNPSYTGIAKGMTS